MKTVAIVGNGRTRTQAPHDDPIRDVWTMNNHAMLWGKRTTAVFEMHPDALTTDRYSAEYQNWLRQPHKFPIYMHDVHPDIPASVKFPLNSVSRYFPTIWKGEDPIRDFFTTTPPYCLALALDMGYNRVELYGIDLDHEERQAHRDSVFFWLGILGANGVDFYMPSECALMDSALYPINTPQPGKRNRHA